MELIFTGPGLTENSTTLERFKKKKLDCAIIVAADLLKSAS